MLQLIRVVNDLQVEGESLISILKLKLTVLPQATGSYGPHSVSRNSRVNTTVQSGTRAAVSHYRARA